MGAAADALRANSLTPAEYRGPVLGLIFLAFAELRASFKGWLSARADGL